MATSEEALATGDQVEIVAVNKLILKVKKLTRREGM
jgi:membrane-bound ClpP family serine protease